MPNIPEMNAIWQAWGDAMTLVSNQTVPANNTAAAPSISHRADNAADNKRVNGTAR